MSKKALGSLDSRGSLRASLPSVACRVNRDRVDICTAGDSQGKITIDRQVRGSKE